MESYGKALIRLLIGCSHIFSKSKRVDIFKRSDAVGMSIIHGSADDMVLNPTLDVLSVINRGGRYLQGENHILLYLNF